eukprot:1680782-Amphidinium_carterae.1
MMPWTLVNSRIIRFPVSVTFMECPAPALQSRLCQGNLYCATSTWGKCKGQSQAASGEAPLNPSASQTAHADRSEVFVTNGS